ncbi:MAG: fibronectin type III domain-containing protein [Eubacterium sp.]|nr:fibronectin type III domain-containing protein [Eubacterium sp.]
MRTTNKVLSVLLSLVMLISIFSATPAFASGSSEFLYKEFEDGTIEIYLYSGTDEDLVIPSALEGKTVTSIATSWLFINDSVKNITLPNTVNNIGPNEFNKWKSLESVRIENKDCTIDQSALTIPYNVKIYGFKDSTAADYAKEFGNKFVTIDPVKASSSTVKITLSASSYVYDGKAKKPSVTVKDTNGKEIDKSNYSVSYSDNTEIGTAKVKLSFKGGYTGTMSKSFKINPKATSLSSISAQYKGFTLKWKKQATQTNGYEIQYSTDKNFKKSNKTATVSKNSTVSQTIKKLTAKKKYYVRIRTYKTVNGTNYYSDWSSSKSITTSSYPTTISLSATSYTYNGKAKKPTVTVKDNGTKIASKYYTVSYSSGRKNVGQYTATIKFKSPYSGTVKKNFKILPKATTLSKVTTGYNGFTVKWKKQSSQTPGYQIQYSTNSSFSNAKTITISNNKTTSRALSGLTGKKKYYVRIRTYKSVKINGKSTKICSAWSKAKSVTTKWRADGVLKLVNNERSKKGIKKISYRNDLQAVADKRAKELATKFDHTRPNGKAWNTAIIEAKIGYKKAGENIACGQMTEAQVMDAWMHSKSHRDNILNKNFTGMAVGCYEKDGVKYWVQLFVG